MLPSTYLWQLHLAVLKLKQRNDTVSRLLCKQDKGSDASAEDTALMDKMEAPMALMVETEDGLDAGMLNFTRFVLRQRKFPAARQTSSSSASGWGGRRGYVGRLPNQTSSYAAQHWLPGWVLIEVKQEIRTCVMLIAVTQVLISCWLTCQSLEEEES